MPRDVMRSTSRARLALCAKVAGIGPVQWLDVTTIADGQRRWVRLLARPVSPFGGSAA